VIPLPRDDAELAHLPAGLAVAVGRQVLPTPAALGLLAVGSLVEVDRCLDHVVSDDEVVAVRLSHMPAASGSRTVVVVSAAMAFR
jgi:hypothetical protein